MPSMKCHQCSSVKTCRMFVADQCRQCGLRRIEHADTAIDHAYYSAHPAYLCGGCAKELGYAGGER